MEDVIAESIAFVVSGCGRAMADAMVVEGVVRMFVRVVPSVEFGF